MNLLNRIVYTGLISLLVNGCSGGFTNTGIPPYGTNLAFESSVKAQTLLDGRMRIDRLDLNDSTIVIQSRLASSVIAYYGSAKYTWLFRIQGQEAADTFVVKGWNKFRITYSGSKDVDYLSFFSTSAEGPIPEQVKFNGKEIPRLEVDEPVSPSYLYILK